MSNKRVKVKFTDKNYNPWYVKTISIEKAYSIPFEYAIAKQYIAGITV